METGSVSASVLPWRAVLLPNIGRRPRIDDAPSDGGAAQACAEFSLEIERVCTSVVLFGGRGWSGVHRPLVSTYQRMSLSNLAFVSALACNLRQDLRSTSVLAAMVFGSLGATIACYGRRKAHLVQA
eukprot:5781553-Amphidinium_carterae.1